jgi:hypothetical protein
MVISRPSHSRKLFRVVAILLVLYTLIEITDCVALLL